MPFDALAMAAMTDEVGETAGGRIQKIVQPSLYGVGLAIYIGGAQRWLLLSADPRFARIQLTTRLAKAFPAPSPFVMLLRKYLDSGRVGSAEQRWRERVMTIRCHSHEGTVDLVCEVMGKHSNVMLVSGDRVILGAVKLVRPSESRVRPILVGRPYVPPPEHGRDQSLFTEGPRVDPAEQPERACRLLEAAAPAAVRAALMGLLPGCGPFLADQIACRAGTSPEASVAEAGITRLVEAAGALFDLYRTRHWQPTSFVDVRGRSDFSPYHPLGVSEVREAPSLSEAISVAVEDAESHDALSTARKEVLDVVDRALLSAERRAASLAEGLDAASEAETYMTYGQLVLAYSHAIEAQQTELVLPELEAVIALDPSLTPAGNAERLFRRYRKLRDARERVPRLLQAAKAEVERLRDLAGFARMAESEGELRALLRDVRADQPQAAKAQRRRPPRYHRGQHTAIAGRNARENEEVTFRLAHRGDLWLHARERTGAHVILQGPSEPDTGAVEAAAALAAYFSEARNDTAVDVDVAAVRDVRKIPGGPPGRVTYRNFRTVRVRPGLGDWTRDR
jgi:predicted ribosome quality control (RQC) complex YloA/Tae2 family protein